MKNLILTEFVLYRNNRKVQLLAFLVILFSIAGTFFVSSLDIGNLAKIKKNEIQQIRGSLETISESDRAKQVGSQKYQTLVTQESLLSTQQMTIIMENNPLYLNTEKELTDLQLTMSEQDSYQDITGFLPSINQLLQTQVTTNYLIKHQLTKPFNTLTGINYTYFFLSLLGLSLSLIVCLFSCDILIDDFERPSLVRGYPVPTSKRIWAKLLLLASLIFFLVLSTLVLGFAVMSTRFVTGQLNYPQAVFISYNHFVPLGFGYFLLLFLGLSVLVIVFCLLLSVLLNMLTRSLYLTLFIELLLIGLPNYFSQLNRLTFFLPFTYLNLTDLLSGKLAYSANQPLLTPVTAFIVLSCWIILLAIIIHNSQRLSEISHTFRLSQKPDRRR